MPNLKLRLVLAITFVMASAYPALAVDTNGAHRTRGAGQFTCAQFIEAKAENGDRYRSFGGWLDGFISAVNFYEQQTFDLAPWQSTDFLAEALSSYCADKNDLPFQEAAKRLMEDLAQQRLPAASKLLLIEETYQGQDVRIAIYEAILERAQSRLKRLGYYEGPLTSAFDDDTRRALQAFQEAANRPQTGLPDQITLLLLFDNSSDKLTR